MKDYRTWQRWTTNFDGQEVSMELKTLDRGSMLQLYPIMEEFQRVDRDAPYAMLEIVDRGVTAIEGHVRDIQGITVNGKEPELEDIEGEMMFTPLMIEIMSRLVTISTLSVESEKNFEGPST